MTHAHENLLRRPWELVVAMSAISFALCIFYMPFVFGVTSQGRWVLIVALCALAMARFKQGLAIVRYQRGLLQLKPFCLGIREVPHAKQWRYLGQGFTWLPIHRQRLHLLRLTENQVFTQKSRWYRAVEQRAKEKPSYITKQLQRMPYFKPVPAIGGKPYLHGVGCDNERAIYLNAANRHQHTVIFGTTGVGKTRLLSILVNQDIQNHDAVLVIDPKGDVEALQDIYSACIAANRIDDLIVLHAGFPTLSAKYNPLASFTNISEVATRVTSAISASGEGQQFKDFAWKFLNIVATCLHEMQESISYKSLAFFVTRPKELLLAYCDNVLAKRDTHYSPAIDTLIRDSVTLDKQGKASAPMTRADAVMQYVTTLIEALVSEGQHKTLQDGIIADLHYAAQLGKEYYDKITASLGPVFDKINKTHAGDIFSWENTSNTPVIRLHEVIKQKKVVYIGLDALTNAAMSNAIGQALIADLVSLCGRLYKDIPTPGQSLCVYADEFAEIVRDEFIQLLNKARGAGVNVTALTQTVNDLGAAFSGNADKAKMLLGNFGTLISLQVKNLDTARMVTECLASIITRSHSPVTQTYDSTRTSHEHFSTSNTDAVNESVEQAVVENDVFSLPKGQAFVLSNGGELYKIRIPLPKNDGNPPPTFEMLLSEVNRCFA